VLEPRTIKGAKGQQATIVTARILACCGLSWSTVLASFGTENPRVGGSIPPLAILPNRCSSIDFAN